MTVFLRLLTSPIAEKGDHLRQQIAALNQGQPAEGIFQADPADFAAIPGTPFAYWISKVLHQLFITQPRFEQDGRIARVGDHPGDHERYVRLFWEVIHFHRSKERAWIPYQKGGEFSRFIPDIHLIVDWDLSRETYFDFYGRKGRSSEHPSNYQLFFRPGLTWSQRTTRKLSVRAYPKGCIFSCKGPVTLVDQDDEHELMTLLAIMNSLPFLKLVELKLGAAEVAARSYDVGIIQQTPIPLRLGEAQDELAKLAQQSYILSRELFLTDETAHVFCLPALLSAPGASLAARLQALEAAEVQRQSTLAALQAQIDARVAELYGVPELLEDEGGWTNNEGRLTNDEGQLTNDEGQLTNDGLSSTVHRPSSASEPTDDDDEETDEPSSAALRPSSVASDFLMWCVGAAFGRWDVRYALHPQSLPALPGPFDPLPVCSPGMLTGQDGLPLAAAPEGYPLPVAWDGFLVDDPGHPRDIVLAVQRVLQLLWPQTADAIEVEACQILGVPDLRAWLRDPKGFFAYHIKRYSKSRRKAPIYWLLQSARRSYAIWLYYPRLNPDSLFRAGREYADAKLSLEIGRLKDLQAGLAAAVGSARKVQERKVAAQEGLAAELKSFQKDLDAAALLELKPDLNDGVLLNIAPLYALVPWKEAERTWQELLRGKYEWSSISKWLRHKGLVKG